MIAREAVVRQEGAEQQREAEMKLMATEKARGTNGLGKGMMRCDCPGSWDWKEQNGKRPPGRRESASDCWVGKRVKAHWKGQGNLEAAQRRDCFQRRALDGALQPSPGLLLGEVGGSPAPTQGISSLGCDVWAQGSCQTDVWEADSGFPTLLSPLQTKKLRAQLGAAGELEATLPSPLPCVGSRSELNHHRKHSSRHNHGDRLGELGLFSLEKSSGRP